MAAANTIDLVGKKFGRLLVIKRDTERLGKYAFWVCVCDCGETKSVVSWNLRKGITTSCGCKRRERFIYEIRDGAQSGKWKGCGEIPGTLWKNVRNGAKSRGLILEVTIQEAWEIFLRQNRLCALSGVKLEFRGRDRLGTASFDRIDSSIGYTKDNVQWVHKDINRLKSNFPENYFIEMCLRVVQTRVGEP